jgi:hypothetical protein
MDGSSIVDPNAFTSVYIVTAEMARPASVALPGL